MDDGHDGLLVLYIPVSHFLIDRLAPKSLLLECWKKPGVLEETRGVGGDQRRNESQVQTRCQRGREGGDARTEVGRPGTMPVDEF